MELIIGLRSIEPKTNAETRCQALDIVPPPGGYIQAVSRAQDTVYIFRVFEPRELRLPVHFPLILGFISLAFPGRETRVDGEELVQVDGGRVAHIHTHLIRAPGM